MALALAPLVTEAVSEREFLTRFLAEWGRRWEGGRGAGQLAGRTLVRAWEKRVNR